MAFFRSDERGAAPPRGLVQPSKDSRFCTACCSGGEIKIAKSTKINMPTIAESASFMVFLL